MNSCEFRQQPSATSSHNSNLIITNNNAFSCDSSASLSAVTQQWGHTMELHRMTSRRQRGSRGAIRKGSGTVATLQVCHLDAPTIELRFFLSSFCFFFFSLIKVTAFVTFGQLLWPLVEVKLPFSSLYPQRQRGKLVTWHPSCITVTTCRCETLLMIMLERIWKECTLWAGWSGLRTRDLHHSYRRALVGEKCSKKKTA